MKVFGLFYFIVLLFLQTSLAQDTYTLQSHSLKINGTSSMHNWTMISGDATGSAKIEMQGKALKGIKSLQVDINGKALYSENKSEGMDEKAHEALKIAANPFIVFKLSQLYIKPAGINESAIEAKGQLTIAGVTREESLYVKSKIHDNGTVHFIGEKKLLMSDFKVKPPKAMMGMLKTGNEITVQFDFAMIKN